MNLTYKKVPFFLVELRPLFLESFQRSRMQFQSHRLVKLQTFMYFIMAQWPGKPRIIVCLHLEEALETVLPVNEVWYVQEEKFALLGLVSILVAHMNKPCGVVLCLCEIIKKSWSHGSNFCFLSHETWSSTPFSICTGIKNRESSKNWDTTDCQLTFQFEWYCQLLTGQTWLI